MILLFELIHNSKSVVSTWQLLSSDLPVTFVVPSLACHLFCPRHILARYLNHRAVECIKMSSFNCIYQSCSLSTLPHNTSTMEHLINKRQILWMLHITHLQLKNNRSQLSHSKISFPDCRWLFWLQTPNLVLNRIKKRTVDVVFYGFLTIKNQHLIMSLIWEPTHIDFVVFTPRQILTASKIFSIPVHVSLLRPVKSHDPS